MVYVHVERGVCVVTLCVVTMCVVTLCVVAMCVVAMCVVTMCVVAMFVVVFVFGLWDVTNTQGPATTHDESEANGEDQDTRRKGRPSKDAARRHRTGRRNQYSEDHDSNRVRQRNRGAYGHHVSTGTALTHGVCGHDRLSVAGRHRMHAPEQRREEQRAYGERESDVALRNQPLEPLGQAVVASLARRQRPTVGCGVRRDVFRSMYLKRNLLLLAGGGKRVSWVCSQ